MYNISPVMNVNATSISTSAVNIMFCIVKLFLSYVILTAGCSIYVVMFYSFSGGLDLILVPGLAFTRSGQRLGRGKGYYDRYLHRYRQLPGMRPLTTVALAFKQQVFDSIPTSEHDVVVDVVLFDQS